MATLGELREGVAARLRTIPGIQAHAKILASPYLPTAYVVPGDIDFHQSFGNGHSEYNLAVGFHVASYTDIGAQDLLDSMLSESGDRSVKEAIEAEPTLGGIADDAFVQGIRNYGPFVRPAGMEPALGARVLVLVLAEGD